MKKFNFNSFLNSFEPKKTGAQFSRETTLGKNIPAQWAKLESDETIQVGSILKVLEAYPEKDISLWFPKYKRAIELSDKARTNIS